MCLQTTEQRLGPGSPGNIRYNDDDDDDGPWLHKSHQLGVAADNRSRGHVDVTPRYTVSRSRLTSRDTEGQCFYNF